MHWSDKQMIKRQISSSSSSFREIWRAVPFGSSTSRRIGGLYTPVSKERVETESNADELGYAQLLALELSAEYDIFAKGVPFYR